VLIDGVVNRLDISYKIVDKDIEEAQGVNRNTALTWGYAVSLYLGKAILTAF
jgi:hypothetical protein